MTLREFLDIFRKDKRNESLSALLNTDDTNVVHLKGLSGSAAAISAATIFEQSDRSHLFILNDKEEAAYFFNDLEALIGNKTLLFYPGSYRRPYQIEETDNANILMRAEVLNHISSRKKNLAIISYPDALFEKVITKKELKDNTLLLKIGESISLDFLSETLYEYKFERVDFVSEPGEFSVRGGIVDVFSFSNDYPYRIEFFGDDVESIRTFDIATQLSVKTVTKLQIVPNIENKTMLESRESFLDYIPDNTVVWTKDMELATEQMDKLFLKAYDQFEKLKSEIKHQSPEELFINRKTFIEDISKHSQIEFGHRFMLDAKETFTYQTSPQPSFNKQFDMLIDDLNEKAGASYQNFILSATGQQMERFISIFEDMEREVSYQPMLLQLHEGFVDETNKICCYTDHQIFERYHKFRLKNQHSKKESISLKELTSLQSGDYVTHIDHGIGKYAGLQKLEVNGKIQEVIKLIYKNNDILYISIHSLHKIARYNGKEGKQPVINQLGSPQWAKTKTKTKTKIKAIAYDLIKLYAKRRAQKGYEFSPDTYLQHELEASFIYEDTPDQLKATIDVKKDMEKPAPMDRLICGDVGFGKTEIAVRAAFKAITDNKQVAILVPTTILALQHYKSFRKRLKNFPCNVDYINRFKTAKQQKETLKKLETGELDILIGTHRIVGKDVKFKDIGLLVIDEEQKFGVAVKDKLKTFKANVDTLTLTATPIPRTLQFSLMAARDLSVMTTPPPNRHPVDTQVIDFNEEAIRDAVSYEISRGGQVFFIHNRIDNIKEVAGMIQRLCPDAKVGIGHGQMDGPKLERLMLDFIEGEFDVLVSTTIIESGLDIPNANTIIINQANNFGLSDLHQMRGRVGRSNKKAFCYLIAPPHSVLTEEARKRLQAIEQFSGLGSGFQIAMRDLEIRGAGDLLGGEQSGFISDIGFDTYQKILNEAIEELKENEFKELYEDETKEKEFIKECQLDTDLEILIPDDYIVSISERLQLYKELNEVENEEELALYEEHIIDRFGALPFSVNQLLDSMRLRWKAKACGFEKLVLKKDKMIGYFPANQDSGFFESDYFGRVLDFIRRYPKSCEMKERNNKLSLVFPNIKTIENAMKVLGKISE